MQLWGCWDVGSFQPWLCGSCWTHQVLFDAQYEEWGHKPQVPKASSAAMTHLNLLLQRGDQWIQAWVSKPQGYPRTTKVGKGSQESNL